MLNQSDPEGVDFDLEVFRTEAALKRRYQEILANHVENSDHIELMMSRLMLALSIVVTLAIGALGLFTGIRYHNLWSIKHIIWLNLSRRIKSKIRYIRKKQKNVLTARIFRKYQRDDPPNYSVSQLRPAGKSLLGIAFHYSKVKECRVCIEV